MRRAALAKAEGLVVHVELHAVVATLGCQLAHFGDNAAAAASHEGYACL